MLNLSMLGRDYDYWKIWRSYYDDRELCAKYRLYADALIEIEMLLRRRKCIASVKENGRLRWYVSDNIYYEIEGCYNAES